MTGGSVYGPSAMITVPKPEAKRSEDVMHRTCSAPRNPSMKAMEA